MRPKITLTDDQIAERLLSKSERGDDENSCWIWTASKINTGYGQINLHGAPRLAHRVSYVLFVGPIPSGMDLDHICRVRSCINPKHLEPVTRSENNKRGLVGKEAARRARERTHCRRGHLLSEDNIKWAERGRRCCKICYETKVKEKNDMRPRSPRKIKTHCPHGHPYAGDNLVMTKRGSRVCRECMRTATREYQRKARGYYSKLSTA